MPSSATGTFEVNPQPLPLADTDAGPLMGRLTINKTFSGGLQATSKGEMLSVSVSVVPDSGTGELTGLTGTLGIQIADGKHFYAMDYEIAPSP